MNERLANGGGSYQGQIVYRCNRRQAWRTTPSGKLLAPGAVDVAFEVHKKIRTPDQWVAWWGKVYP